MQINSTKVCGKNSRSQDMYGFPATMYLSKEVAEVTAENETERQIIENYLLPKMNIAGFVTGSFATVLAGIFGGMM